MNDQGLGPKSPIDEIFEAVTPEEGMRVLPTQLPAPEGKAHLAILITGNADEANVVMANLMSYVTEMHDTAEQAAHDPASIVGANGEPVDEQPAIIIP